MYFIYFPGDSQSGNHGKEQETSVQIGAAEERTTRTGQLQEKKRRDQNEGKILALHRGTSFTLQSQMIISSPKNYNPIWYS